MSEPGVIRLSKRIPFAVSDVWRALTEPELLAAWWAAGDVRPIVGHTFTLDMGPFGQQSCQVTNVEQDRLFAYTFGGSMLPTTITWTLEAEDGATLLTLEHAGFDLDSEMGMRAYQGMGAGWPGILDRIEPALAEKG